MIILYCKVFKYKKKDNKLLMTIPYNNRIKNIEILYSELDKMIVLLCKNELNSLKEALFKKGVFKNEPPHYV